MSSPRMACYRYYDDKATIIYVGITGSLSKRHSEHMRLQEWAPEVYSFFAEWFDDPERAEFRELELISTHRPKYNTASKPTQPVSYPDPSVG